MVKLMCLGRFGNGVCEYMHVCEYNKAGQAKFTVYYHIFYFACGWAVIIQIYKATAKKYPVSHPPPCTDFLIVPLLTMQLYTYCFHTEYCCRSLWKTQ